MSRARCVRQHTLAWPLCRAGRALRPQHFDVAIHAPANRPGRPLLPRRTDPALRGSAAPGHRAEEGNFESLRAAGLHLRQPRSAGSVRRTPAQGVELAGMLGGGTLLSRKGPVAARAGACRPEVVPARHCTWWRFLRGLARNGRRPQRARRARTGPGSLSARPRHQCRLARAACQPRTDDGRAALLRRGASAQRPGAGVGSGTGAGLGRTRARAGRTRTRTGGSAQL